MMETKQQTDESIETPSNGENKENLSHGENKENKSKEESNNVSDIKSDDLEMGLKDKGAQTPLENNASEIPSSMRKKLNEWIKTNPLTTLFITIIAGLIVIAIPKIIILQTN